VGSGGFFLSLVVLATCLLCVEVVSGRLVLFFIFYVVSKGVHLPRQACHLHLVVSKT
jgi:hypothetical protein